MRTVDVNSPESDAKSSSLWAFRCGLLALTLLTGAAVWRSFRDAKSTPAAAPKSAASRPQEVRVGDRVLLGSPSLFAGIPGGEKLTVDAIQKWLADPVNHEPIDFELPLWLRSSRAELMFRDDEPLTRAKIELGRQLFMETRFVDGGFSCSQCHHPQQGYSRPSNFTHHKNPPPVFNRLLSTRQFWDGRADSLEHQIEFPIGSVQEMHSSPAFCEETLRKIAGYRLQFERIYGQVSFANMCKAIAAFERALVTGPGAYDYYRVQHELEARDPATLSPDEKATLEEARTGAKARPMSAEAVRGMELFFSDRTNCASCHSGPNFTDEDFHNLGIGEGVVHLHESGGFSVPDVGRIAITKKDDDYGKFKTPTLRNLESTGAFFHDNSAGSLEDAVRYLAKGGTPNRNLSPLIRPLSLSDGEINDLVAFLKSLQGDLAVARTVGLPE